MKKFKIFLLIITILLMILMIFASCRKTKALTDLYNPNVSDTIVITSTDTNSGFVGLYMFGDLNSLNDNFRTLLVQYTNGYFYIRVETVVQNGNRVPYNIHLIGTAGYDVANYSTTSDTVGIILILGENSNNDLCLDIATLRYYTGTSQYLTISHNYYYFAYNYFDDVALMTDYNSNSGISCSYLDDNNYIGTYNVFWYDCLDYSLTFTEQSSEVSSEIIKLVNEQVDDIIFESGYDAGYLDGYHDGEYDGYQAGYTAGYQAGVSTQTAYDDGYDDGYQDGVQAGLHLSDAYVRGWNDGWDVGYQDGFNNGYNDGYVDGQEGRTAFTPAFNVLTGVFNVVGSVMSINLVPGVPLGLFFLVPLFFAVIGLVLWIWRKNG